LENKCNSKCISFFWFSMKTSIFLWIIVYVEQKTTKENSFTKEVGVTLCLQIRVLKTNCDVNTIYKISLFHFTFAIQ